MNLRPGVIKTNPVLAIQTKFGLLAQANEDITQLQLRDWLKNAEKSGVRFPSRIIGEYFDLLSHFEVLPRTYEPRVIGLAVDSQLKTGLVCPISCTLHEEPSRSSNFPFELSEIQNTLLALVEASGRQKSQWSSTLAGCKFEEEIGKDMEGESMTVAALLALVDAHNEFSSAVFEKACAVVMPRGNQLVSVNADTIKLKLDAFVREFATGALLVYHPDCKVSPDYFGFFKERWPVSSFEELASWLCEVGQLAKLFENRPLSEGEINFALETIAGLNRARQYERALNHALRLKSCLSRPNPKVGQWITDLCRHTGRFDAAISRSRQYSEDISSRGDYASYDEELNAKIDEAAGLFDQHDFQAVVNLLQSEVAQVEGAPQSAPVLTRCKLFNTLARAMVVVGISGWKNLFEKSIGMQEAVDGQTPEVSRNFLIHGLLRHEEFSKALGEIEKQQQSEISDTSELFLHFFRADLARRKNESYEMPAGRKEAIEGKPGAGDYAYGFLLQAIARHPKNKQKAADMFTKAAEFFEPDSDADSEINILVLFALFMRLAASCTKKRSTETRKILQQINEFLDRPRAASLKAYYEKFLATEEFGEQELEQLLNAVPYF